MDDSSDKIILIIYSLAMGILFFTGIGFCIIRAYLIKFNTPWRVIDKNNNYKIQQKFGKFWITTYEFAYGCQNQKEIEKSFLDKKSSQRKYTKIIKEYPASNHE